MRNTVRALSLAVDGQINASLSMLQTLAASAYLDTGEFKAFYDLCVRAIEGRKNEYIILFDPSGQQLVNSSRPFGSSLPNPIRGAQVAGADTRYPELPVGGAAPVRKALETGQPVVSDLFVSLVTKQPRISIDVPVIRAGVVRYVLELSFDPEIFIRLLLSHQLPGDSVANIVDGKGLVIARNLDPGGRVGRPLAPELAAQIGMSEKASYRGHTVEGVPVYHAIQEHRLDDLARSIAARRHGTGASRRHAADRRRCGSGIARGGTSIHHRQAHHNADLCARLCRPIARAR
jgi:hypothetical protein